MPVGKYQDFVPQTERAGEAVLAQAADAAQATVDPGSPWSLFVTLSATQTNGIYMGDDRVPNGTGAQVRFRQLNFQPSYEFSPEFRGSFTLPIVDIKKREGFQPPIDKGGIGDVSLFGEWTPGGGGLTVMAGVKFPTGDTSDAPAPGLVPPTLLQQGTGTFDPLFGVSYYGALGTVGYHVDSLLQLPIGASDAGLNPSNTLYVAVGSDYYGLPGVYPGVEFVAIWRGRDYINSAPIANTGAALYFVKPQVRVDLGDGFTVSASARVPVIMSVNATQIVPGVLYSFGIGIDF